MNRTNNQSVNQSIKQTTARTTNKKTQQQQQQHQEQVEKKKHTNQHMSTFRGEKTDKETEQKGVHSLCTRKPCSTLRKDDKYIRHIHSCIITFTHTHTHTHTHTNKQTNKQNNLNPLFLKKGGRQTSQTTCLAANCPTAPQSPTTTSAWDGQGIQQRACVTLATPLWRGSATAFRRVGCVILFK